MTDFFEPCLSAGRVAEITGISDSNLREWRKRGLLDEIGVKSGEGRQARVLYSMFDALILWIANRQMKCELDWRIFVARISARRLVEQMNEVSYSRFIVFFDDYSMNAPKYVVTGDVTQALQSANLWALFVQVVDMFAVLEGVPDEIIVGLRSTKKAV